MRKKIIIPFAVLSISILLAQSCEKETIPTENLEISKIPYEHFENEVVKEIAITDASNESTVFIRVYSDKITTLETFLSTYEFQLITEKYCVENEIFNTISPLDESVKKDLTKYGIEKEPKIFVEIATMNLQPGVKNCFIDITSSKKNALYTPGYPVGYTTYDGFIGTVHKGLGSEFIVQWTYKYKWYSSLEYWEVNGANAWYIYPNPAQVYYGALGRDFYKINMIIRPDIYQTTINYRVALTESSMRGQSCSLVGSYDSDNCYIGTAPTGTNAFFYTYGSGNTYCMYSPVNGNQCPLSGSVFDGANCRYTQIPAGAEKFLFNNGWYVKSDIIDEYN